MEKIFLIEQLEFLEKLELKKERKMKKRKDFFVEFDDLEFRRRFRLSKESVIEVTLLVHDELQHKSGLNNALSPVEQVLVALRFYAAPCMQVAIADLFEISQPTVCRVIHRVSEAIASLLPQYISLPADKEECKEVSGKIFNIGGFPSVIGTLDCTLVRIIGSSRGEDAERFRCGKDFFALNVQTIVDADLLIRNVEASWPGSTHDSTIFTNSGACSAIQTNSIYENYHLLGDSGYSLEKYLLTPFLNPRTPGEVRYNKSHVLTRNTIKKKYGILKRRFPCLSFGFKCEMERVPAIIIACCVLHNLAIHLADPEPPADPQIEALLQKLERDNIQLESTQRIGVQSDSAPGLEKRSALITNYFSP